MRYLLLLTILTFCYHGYSQHSLVDQGADAAVINLANHLRKWSKDKILFGQQDALAYGVHWKKHRSNRSDVKDLVRSHPALIGWELSKLGQGPYNIDSVEFKSMQKWIKKVHRQGGINSISWHMDNFVTMGNSWDTAGSVVEHILPGGKHHSDFVAKLDLFVAFLGELKDRGKPIPIIFRPYHEHSGSWFWWGEALCTPEEYKALWQFTVKYLRDQKNVHQLLYAYSPDAVDDSSEYLERYPGDEYVDIMGLDDYRDVGQNADHSRLAVRLEMVVDLADKHGKIAALTETGQESIPEPEFWTKTLMQQLLSSEKTKRIAYVMVWRNARLTHHYGPFKGHASAEDFKIFAKNKNIWLLKDLPKWQ